MKRFLCALLLLGLLSVGNAHAEAVQIVPSVSAPSAVLMEKLTGQVIYEKNGGKHMAPASVTKIMTMLLIAEEMDAGRLHPDDIVTASARAASFGGSCVYLAEGERMTAEEMLKCIAVVSANDCAVAMAEHISGSEAAFVAGMNERASQLGMENTHFTNCTGLFDDKEHYTCAYDVAVMSRQLLQHEWIKDYSTIWMDSIRNGEFELSNTNRLVYWYDGCTGLKTGYTEKAGYCLAATAEREGVEYIAVVMDGATAESRNYDAEQMLSFAFANYRLCSLRGDMKEPLIPVELGRAESVKCVFAGPEYALIPKNSTEPSYELQCEKRVAAPVKQGDKLGVLTIRTGENVISRISLLAAEDVERLSYLGLLGYLAGGIVGL